MISLQHRLHFRRIRLGVVAIQIQPFRGRTPTREFRAVLVGSIEAPHAFMAVGIECRHEQHGDALECARSRGARQ